MRNVTRFDTTAELIAKIAKDPQDFFRRARVIGVQPATMLHGKAYVSYYDVKNMESTSLPATAAYLKKCVIALTEKGGIVPTIVTTKPAYLPVLAIAGTFDPEKLEAPNDRHLRWKTSTPATDSLTGYTCYGDSALVIDNKTFTADRSARIQDIQVLGLGNGDFVFHVHSNGVIYEAIASIRDLEDLMMPRFTKRMDGVNSFLTIPVRGETTMVVATNNGLYINDNVVDNTKGKRIENIAADSEANRVYFHSQGMIFGLKFDENWQLTSGQPIPIDDRMVGNYPWSILMSGPVVKDEKGLPGLLLDGWNLTADKREYSETSLFLPIPAAFTNPELP
jgi:hypothetical protein